MIAGKDGVWMDWNVKEAVTYYKKQGAPGDQSALTALLWEMQEAYGGAVPGSLLPDLAEALGVKESFLLALIKRLPSLHLAEETPLLELCAGPNCPKKANLAGFVEKTYGKDPKAFTLRYTGCMRQCGKGPNIRWKGEVYNGVDEVLLRRLIEGGP